ncbi:MAG: HAMP domain-containing protein [Acidobacteriaceae bacterium]|nr:HAMP domain-containing protein [Acidobacteriaceae bacterium]
MGDARGTIANLLRGSNQTIGVRLTACFLAIVIVMIAADAVVLWQLQQIAAQMHMLNEADKASSAIVRLHLDVNSFSREVAVLTRTHDTRTFVNEAASVRESFLRHVRDAEQTLTSSREIAEDALISSTLRTLKTTLPSQIDTEIELANAGDWSAIQLRLTGQIQDLINLSSSLADGVEERVFRQRARVNEQTEQVRRRLFVVVPIAWVLSLLAAAALGWYVTRTITVPLSELTTGARALARGDFRHEVKTEGNDELAVLGKAFNHAGRQLRHQFEMTLEARVAERMRIARELHDTLLQSFHGLLLRFQTVHQLLPDCPVDAKEKLGSAIEHAAEAITEGRDAVQDLRDSTLQANDLATSISTLGQELATDSGNHRSEFSVAVEGDARDLHPIVRDEVYKITAEALRNAFRHAHARRVEVEIRYGSEQFRLRVRDDGKGIDNAVLSAQASEGHFGLPGMRERATLMGAELTIWSEVNAGTELELRVPGEVVYALSRRLS